MPDYKYERRLMRRGLERVCGVDEAGRGPLAGPVVVAAVVIEPKRLGREVVAALDDSKRLSREVREDLAREIEARGSDISIAIGDVAEIERLNILHSTMAAMARAVAGLGTRPLAALVDGNRAPDLACECQTVVEGDGRCLSIAAASVIAKVTRDRMMTELAETFPGYGWESNAGYGTPGHLAALARLGVTPHHRRGFAPVRQYLESPELDLAISGETSR